MTNVVTPGDQFVEAPTHGVVRVTDEFPRVGRIVLEPGWVHVYGCAVLESLPVHRVDRIDWQAPKDDA